MGVSTFHTNPDGVRIMVNSDILSVAERIQKGDPTCAWSGDERMFVVFNNLRKRYEVWRACEDGVDRIISSWEPREFDVRVIKHLAEHDTRVHDILARLDKENEATEKARLDRIKELGEELHKDVQWMARKLYLPGTDPAPYTGNDKNAKRS